MGSPRVLAVPVEVLASPRDGEVLTNRWWVVRDGKALFWQALAMRGWAPQCNSDQRLPERLIERLYPDATSLLIPVAFVGPWDEARGYTLTEEILAAGEISNGSTACSPSTPVMTRR